MYELALKEINLKASEVVFLDDSLRNITAAGSMGIFTVLVRREGGNFEEGSRAKC